MAAEVTGLGYTGDVVNAPFEDVWHFMVHKVYNPTQYIGATDVVTKDEEGYVFREMSVHGNHKKEHIYLDKDNGIIAFHDIANDEVIINQYHKATKRIEYWKENKDGHRIHWEAPAHIIANAIRITKEQAEGSAKAT